MKQAIMKTLLIASLAACWAATPVLAASDSDQQENKGDAEQACEESTECDWQDALATQVELAKTKVSLLQAQTDLWLEKNAAAAQDSLDEADASLDRAWQSADEATQARIAELKTQIALASELLREKGEEADRDLRALADRSETALNAALTETQAKSAMIRDEVSTRYALAEAKAAALKARVALEIEESPAKAEQAMRDAEAYLEQAKSTASDITAEKVTQLQDKARAARQSIHEATGSAKSRINELVASTDEHLQAYEKAVRESDEAKLLKKRYAQLEARAALLKAQLAHQADATGQRAARYLNEANAWYASTKVRTAHRWNTEVDEMSARIEDTKQAVDDREQEARNKIAELLERAAEMVKDDDSAQDEDTRS